MAAVPDQVFFQVGDDLFHAVCRGRRQHRVVLGHDHQRRDAHGVIEVRRSFPVAGHVAVPVDAAGEAGFRKGIDEHLLLKGGRGGKGNEFFKTSVNQAPEHAQPGEEGEEIEVKLELKLIADVGIIGFPNAGKSTLISRISAAKPKIADYPFTTLTPNLGVVKAGDYSSFVVADIPGLVKGAHEGVGLGIQFLKHVERTRVFIHLVDASGMSGRDPLQDYEDINFELKMYDENNQDKEGFFPLSTRPQFVVLNKIDTLSTDQLQKLINSFKKVTGTAPLAISAVTGKNINELVIELGRQILKEEEE